MTEIPEPIRRAILAQEKRTRGRVSLAKVEEALSDEHVIPSDEIVQAEERGFVPEADDLSDAERAMIQPELPSVHEVPHARSGDIATSALSGALTEAEEGTTAVLKPGSLKHLALREIALHGPLTANEVERRTEERGIWKRVSDLKNAMLVTQVSVRTDPETHRENAVWSITRTGLVVLGNLDGGQEVRLPTR